MELNLWLITFLLLSATGHGMSDKDYKTKVRNLLQKFLYQLYDIQKMRLAGMNPVPVTGSDNTDDRNPIGLDRSPAGGNTPAGATYNLKEQDKHLYKPSENTNAQALVEEGNQAANRVFDILDNEFPGQCLALDALCSEGGLRCCPDLACSNALNGHCKVCVPRGQSCTFNWFCCGDAKCVKKEFPVWVCE